MSSVVAVTCLLLTQGPPVWRISFRHAMPLERVEPLVRAMFKGHVECLETKSDEAFKVSGVSPQSLRKAIAQGRLEEFIDKGWLKIVLLDSGSWFRLARPSRSPVGI